MTTKSALGIDDNTFLQKIKMLSLANIIGSRSVFALQFCGESMRDEHILDGDYLLIEEVSKVADGDLVVARLHEIGTVVRRYYTEDPIVRLQTSNFDVNPIMVSARQVEILGRVIGLLRDGLCSDNSYAIYAERRSVDYPL